MFQARFQAPWYPIWGTSTRQRTEVQEVLLLAADRFEANGKIEKAEQIRSSAQAIRL